MKKYLILVVLISIVIVTFSWKSSLTVSASQPSDFGLKEGDLISAIFSDDPDVYIINEHGYKRLFLNPEIFKFYKHLGGFASVKLVDPEIRDAFPTVGLFRNCEKNDSKVYGFESDDEDNGKLRWVDTTGEQAVKDDPDFFKKVFCINDKEFTWYPKGNELKSVQEVPQYHRTVPISSAISATPAIPAIPASPSQPLISSTITATPVSGSVTPIPTPTFTAVVQPATPAVPAIPATPAQPATAASSTPTPTTTTTVTPTPTPTSISNDSLPVITALIQPANDVQPATIYAGLKASILVTITDDKGITFGEFNAPGMRYTSDNVSLSQCSNGVTSCSEPAYIVVPNQPGGYTITIKATDTVGQMATKIVTFTAAGCSTDFECGGSYFPSSGATFCGPSGATLYDKRMKYLAGAICYSGGCNNPIAPGVLEDCAASGKICGFSMANGGQDQCVVSPGVSCTSNAAITSSCICGQQSYEQYGYCCSNSGGGLYHSISSCPTAVVDSQNSLAVITKSFSGFLKFFSRLFK